MPLPSSSREMSCCPVYSAAQDEHAGHVLSFRVLKRILRKNKIQEFYPPRNNREIDIYAARKKAA